jgi:hypothetical protein
MIPGAKHVITDQELLATPVLVRVHTEPLEEDDSAGGWVAAICLPQCAVRQRA